LAEGWESVLTRSKRSDNFKRRLKKLTRSHDLEFRSVTEQSSVDVAFERFLALHEQRWSVAGGSELTGHPRLIEFQRRIVQRLSQAGLVRFDELWVDGRCTSSVYGLDNGRTFYYYNSGYDLSYSNLSVGLVLLGLSIKSAFERGNTLYDFLRGNEEYKFDWATGTEQLVTVSLNGRSVPVLGREFARQGNASLRDVARSILPARLSETLQSWRRAAKRSHQMSAR
jgi:CelD/BcsL family acetyltransferase involved in cellulose biosynthesis